MTSERKPKQPKGIEHALWPAFLRFAGREGIGVYRRREWLPWWRTFLAGALAGVQETEQRVTRKLVKAGPAILGSDEEKE